MEGSVLSFLRAEWKVSDTGSAQCWASSVGIVLAETQQRRDIGMLITESTIECSSVCD
jgi:hypothetical protein